MKQMKNKTMAMLFALALTASLVWGINEEAQAAKSCDNPRCNTDEDVCEKGNAISLRSSCKDENWGGIRCELALPCNFPMPDFE